jgi:hypothetical protein
LDQKQIDFIINLISVESANNKSCSTFSLALRDARFITGRDLLTGECKHYLLQNNKNQHLKPYSPICLLNYLIILEMVGKIFKMKNQLDSTNGIVSALFNFSDLEEKDRYTINALRNALAHSYSLTNIPEKEKYYEHSRHLFAYHITGDFPLIQYSDNEWNGGYYQIESRTWIQINKLFNLIEIIVKSILGKIGNDEIELQMDIAELETRYYINY